jgi:hypothetical protein
MLKEYRLTKLVAWGIPSQHSNKTRSSISHLSQPWTTVPLHQVDGQCEEVAGREPLESAKVRATRASLSRELVCKNLTGSDAHCAIRTAYYKEVSIATGRNSVHDFFLVHIQREVQSWFLAATPSPVAGAAPASSCTLPHVLPRHRRAPVKLRHRTTWSSF